MWAIHQSGKLTQTQMHEPKWTSDWNGWETGYVVWFAWVTSLLISLLPFILMIIAKKDSFMKTFFFFLKDYFTPRLKPALRSFSSQLPRVGLPSLQLLRLYVKHVLVPWPVERGGPWPCSVCIWEPSRVPCHTPLSEGGFSLHCTSRQWENSRMDKGKVKNQSLLE